MRERRGLSEGFKRLVLLEHLAVLIIIVYVHPLFFLPKILIAFYTCKAISRDFF